MLDYSLMEFISSDELEMEDFFQWMHEINMEEYLEKRCEE
jgi:hypothetical protein